MDFVMATRPHANIRVLLIEPDDRKRKARANRLFSMGYRVSALPDTDGAPPALMPRLYDAVIVSVDGMAPSVVKWCTQVGADGAPALVFLADSAFSLPVGFIPALVISEQSESAVDEKLLAFLASVMDRPRTASDRA